MQQKGYRVGGQCFATSEEASDYKLSMVVPTITGDGSLKMPVRKNDGWYYGSQKIQLTHPQCNPLEAFQDGMLVGGLILLLFIISYAFKQTIFMFNRIFSQDKIDE